MVLFISWSGEISKKIALVLRDWIPSVIPIIAPWVSSEDIPKGSRWGVEVANKLGETYFGIICIVPDNMREPWLLFEAGALSKSVAESRVFPLLFGVEPSQLPEPLAQFQATTFGKEDVRKLMQSLNNPFGQPSIPPEQLDRTFEYSWVGLQAKLDPLLKAISSSPINPPKGGPAPTPTADLSEEQVKILKLLVDYGEGGLPAHGLSRGLQMPIEKVRYYLDGLLDQKYVTNLFVMGDPPKYLLSKRGRAFLVENGLL